MGGRFLCLSKLSRPKTQHLPWIEQCFDNPSRQNTLKPDIDKSIYVGLFCGPRTFSRTHPKNIASLTETPTNDQQTRRRKEVVIFFGLAARETTCTPWNSREHGNRGRSDPSTSQLFPYIQDSHCVCLCILRFHNFIKFRI